jgi:hypothetical protein
VRNRTNEEKLAKIIGDYVSDLRLDLELVGRYLAWYLPNVAYRRILIILEAMTHEREDNKNEYNYDRD